LAVRYTGVRLDKDIWTNGLLGAGQANKANTWSVGVNWYATDNLQASLSYDNTHFSGGQTGGGDRKSDQAILTRLQVSF
jgi:phosphate-selective porin